MVVGLAANLFQLKSFFQAFKLLELLLGSHRLELFIRKLFRFTHDLSLLDVAPNPLIQNLRTTETIVMGNFFGVEPFREEFSYNSITVMLRKSILKANNFCTILSIS